VTVRRPGRLQRNRVYRGGKMAVITELNQIISLLEAQIPANPNAPANLKLRKRLEGELVKYFNKLEKAFPYSRLSGIYNRYVEKE